MANYIALLRKESKSDYGVDFPDFPGCITAGKTLEEAKDMAQEALQGHINIMAEYGEDIAEASTLEKIMGDPDNKDAVAFLVEVRLAKVKARRINITFPEDTLSKVDRYVAAHPKQNRSKVLAQAAEQFVDRAKPKRVGTVRAAITKTGTVTRFGKTVIVATDKKKSGPYKVSRRTPPKPGSKTVKK
jgi:predicted RNase H-like HicB family nuclease